MDTSELIDSLNPVVSFWLCHTLHLQVVVCVLAVKGPWLALGRPIHSLAAVGVNLRQGRWCRF